MVKVQLHKHKTDGIWDKLWTGELKKKTKLKLTPADYERQINVFKTSM